VLACGINIGQQFTGQGSLTMYSTLIYKKVFKSNSEIQLINALNGTFGIFFTLNATWMVDRFGRRALLLIGAAGMSMCMFIVAAVVTETPNLADGAKSKPVGIATVFLMFLFALFYKPSWGATVWIWTSEIFSMNIRAQAIGMATQSQSISNTILRKSPSWTNHHSGYGHSDPIDRANLPYIPRQKRIVSRNAPLALKFPGHPSLTSPSSRNSYAMYMFGAINVVLFAFVWFLIPESKGVALEHMDTIFGGVDHAHEGAEMMERNPKDQEVIAVEVENASRPTKAGSV
jgi:MFS family permease